MGFKDVKQATEGANREIESIYHILTGISDTLVLVLENAALGRLINDTREENRKLIPSSPQQESPYKSSASRYTAKVPKIGTRMIRTASTNYRIHSKRLKTKERKIFLDNLTHSNRTKDESATKEQNESLVLAPKTIFYKGDRFELDSL